MNKKTLFLRILFSTLLIGTFILIFCFSEQSGETSTETSTGFLYDAIDFINGNKKIDNNTIEIIDPLFRKIAHFSIYTTVGIWSISLLYTFFTKLNEKEQDRKRMIISILIGFLYACSDEIHQLFSTNRSGSIIDVVIDTMGVLNGIIIVMILLKIFKKT